MLSSVPTASQSVRRMSLADKPSLSPSPGLHLELTSCSQCPHCHRLLYDEVGAWDPLGVGGAGGSKSHSEVKHHTTSPQVIMANWSESESDYKTRCPYCSSYVVASLTIVKKQVRIRVASFLYGLSHLLMCRVVRSSHNMSSNITQGVLRDWEWDYMYLLIGISYDSVLK